MPENMRCRKCNHEVRPEDHDGDLWWCVELWGCDCDCQPIEEK